MCARNRRRGQGALEYLLLLAGLIFVSTVAFTLSQGTQTSTGQQVNASYSQIVQQLKNTPTPSPAPVTPVPDTTSPNVSLISPTSASVGVSTTYSATATDNVWLSSCDFYWNGAKEGTMSLAGGLASYTKTVGTPGSYPNVYANCSDASGNRASGAGVSVGISDISPPALIAFDSNVSSVVAGNPVEHFAQWSDNVALSGFIFASNYSLGGSLVNDSWLPLPSLNWSNVTKVPSTAGTFAWKIFANDSSNNWASTTEKTIAVTGALDTAAPQYSSVGANDSTPTVGELVKHYTFWSDNNALSGFIFSSNYSGAWANDSWVQTISAATWSNVSRNAPSLAGTYGWRIYANDSSNNWNATQEMTITTILDTAPIFSSVGANDSTPTVGELVRQYAFWTDDQALSGFIFSSNYSGAWENDSWVQTISAATWSNATKTLPTTVDEYGWRIYANDSSNNWNATPIQTVSTSVVDDFESGNLATWIVSGTSVPYATGTAGVVITGGYSAYIGGTYGGVVGHSESADNYAINDAIINKTFQLPSSFALATLSFRAKVVIGGSTYDHVRVTLYNASNAVNQWATSNFGSGLTASTSCVSLATAATNTYSYSIPAAYAGKNLSFYARAHNGGWCAYASIDDVQVIITPPETVPPQYSGVGINDSTPRITETILHSTLWSDNTAFSGFIFSSNYTGTWENDSWTPMSGASNWSNVSKTLPSAVGAYGWRVYANDSSNNWNATPIQAVFANARCDFESGDCGYYARYASFSCSASYNCPTIYKCPDTTCSCSGSRNCVNNLLNTTTVARSKAGTTSYVANVSLSAGTTQLYTDQYIAISTPQYAGGIAGKSVTFWKSAATIGGTSRHAHGSEFKICNSTSCATYATGSCSCDISTNCANYPYCLNSELNTGFQSSAAGVDGTTWYRYTYSVPATLGNSYWFEWRFNLYKWSSNAYGSNHTNYWLDDFCVSDASGNCLA